MPRVFIPFDVNPSQDIEVRGEPARYVNNVLRLRRGAPIVIFDPRGEHFDASVASVSRTAVRIAVGQGLGRSEEPTGGVSLVPGVIKGKMDIIIQKAVELGVAEIRPVFMERSVLHETRKHDRWLKIALEAARQCGRSTAPPVHEPVDLGEFLSGRERIEGVVFYEDNEPSPLLPEDASTSSGLVTVVIGPEGGFTDAEIGLLRAKGLRTRSLGRNILRADTAAIASVALMQYMLGRLG